MKQIDPAVGVMRVLAVKEDHFWYEDTVNTQAQTHAQIPIHAQIPAYVQLPALFQPHVPLQPSAHLHHKPSTLPSHDFCQSSVLS